MRGLALIDVGMAADAKARQACLSNVKSGRLMIMANAHVQPRWCVANGNHTAQDAR